jgi:hypothetical protein
MNFTRGPAKAFCRNNVSSVMDAHRGEIVHWAGFDAATAEGATSIKARHANARLIAAAFNAATALDTAGYDAMACIEKMPEMMKALDGLSEALWYLIEGSRGVCSLHLNGDDAPWTELLAGGQFEEWLKALDKADAFLAKARKP